MKNHRFVLLAAILIIATASARADVEYPTGVQDFEALPVGTGIDAGLPPWFTVNTSTPPSLYTVVGANDVLGSQTPRGSSTRWLRISDTDAGNVQNRFYSGTIVAPQTRNYAWTYWVNLEALPPGGANVKPKLVIQHNDSAGFANAWGVEFTATGANLTVLGIGGVAASTPLFPISSPTGIGDWVKIRLAVIFDNNTVSASVNDGPSVSLPINLSATADKRVFRFCYRGEGTGNSNAMLVDDVSFEVTEPIPAASTWALIVMTLLIANAGVLLAYRSRALPV